jgi:hypothetical protein
MIDMMSATWEARLEIPPRSPRRLKTVSYEKGKKKKHVIFKISIYPVCPIRKVKNHISE